MLAFRWKPSLQQRIITLLVTVVLLILVIVGYLFNLIVTKSVQDSAGKNALDVARLVAGMPDIKQALSSHDASSYLQPRTSQLKSETHADFIVITDTEGIRYTHNNPDLIGKPFTGGDEGPALQGQEYVSTADGISGPSIRAFVPVKQDGHVLGVIVVGLFYSHVYRIVSTYISLIGYTLSFGLALAIVLSILLAKSVKKTMYGLEPDEIASILREREALVDCLHEGVLAIDKKEQVSLVNESARTILSLPSDMVGKPLSEVIPSSNLVKVITSPTQEHNAETSVNNVTVIVNRAPIIVNHEVVGAVSTFRDITELRSLAEELTGVKQYVEGLRAKTHEFMNRLQTIHGLLELKEYEEAKSFILQTTKTQQQLLRFLTHRIGDPKTSALLLGKMQQAEERDILFKLDPASRISSLPTKISTSFVLILGNLIENALDAVEENAKGEVTVTLLEQPSSWTVLVEDNGQGIMEHELPRIFEKHYSTKHGDRGYGLYLVKNQIDNVLGGQIEVHSTPSEGTTFYIFIPRP